MTKSILIAGGTGFIGYHLSKKLSLNEKNTIIGIDNLNSYYSVKLKKIRISNLKKNNFIFKKIDIKNLNLLKKLFIKYKFDYVINLAAQAGVRYSIENPRNYLENNVNGFFNILELCKEFNIKHLVYFRFLKNLIQISHYLFMLQQRNVMKLWLIIMQIYINFKLQV